MHNLKDVNYWLRLAGASACSECTPGTYSGSAGMCCSMLTAGTLQGQRCSSVREERCIMFNKDKSREEKGVKELVGDWQEKDSLVGDWQEKDSTRQSKFN